MSFSEFSQPRLARMHDTMAGYIDRGEIPGMITLVSRKGETHVEVMGTMAADGTAPLQRDSIFRIASLTKPIAAAAAMILIEECRIRLDDSVERWLPELADRTVLKRVDGPIDETVPAKRPITVRDLLTMRMGLGYLMTAPGDWPIQQATQAQEILQGPPQPMKTPAPDDWIKRVAAVPLMYQPGEKWMYDISMEVLGVLLARATGQRLDTFFHERLFSPLGMKDTGFYAPAQKSDRLVTSYWTSFTTGKVEIFDPAVGGQWNQAPQFPSAAGGLVSTLDDYFTFTQMLLNKGKHRGEQILSRASVETMTTDQLTAEQRVGSEMFLGDNRSWGLGLSVFTHRNELAAVPGSFGWDGGLGTSWYSDPKADVTGILLTQQAWMSPEGPNVWRDFWTSTYQAMVG